jgi:hypothetical protein
MLGQTEKNGIRNIWAIENAIAQQRLEGLEPSQAAIADMVLVVQGKITISDAIDNIGKRFRNDQIRLP